MVRVLRKPNGLIVWYDFWVNPRSSETRGIRRAELKRLFPGCTLDIRSLTLAPPIVRRLAPRSRLACDALEGLHFLNTHYLVSHQAGAGRWDPVRRRDMFILSDPRPEPGSRC